MSYGQMESKYLSLAWKIGLRPSTLAPLTTIYIYYGQMESKYLSLAWKLDLHLSTSARLTAISRSDPK
jgi:hypothetical protein